MNYYKSRAELETIKDRMLEERGFSTEELLQELMSAMDTAELEEDLRWIDNQHDLGLFDEEPEDEPDDDENDEEPEEEEETYRDRGELLMNAEREMRQCQECRDHVPAEVLEWVTDAYGIPYKLVCPECSERVEREIKGRRYGDELSHDEIYGEDE